MIVISNHDIFVCNDDYNFYVTTKGNLQGIDTKMPHEVINVMLWNLIEINLSRRAIEKLLKQIGHEMRLLIYRKHLADGYDTIATNIRRIDNQIDRTFDVNFERVLREIRG